MNIEAEYFRPERFEHVASLQQFPSVICRLEHRSAYVALKRQKRCHAAAPSSKLQKALDLVSVEERLPECEVLPRLCKVEARKGAVHVRVSKASWKFHDD